MKSSPDSTTHAQAPVGPRTDQTDVARLWETHWANHSVPDEHEAQSRFATEAFRALAPHLGQTRGPVLEIACGTGRLVALTAAARPEVRVVGVDISTSSLRLASRLKAAMRVENVSLTQGNLFALPYADDAFDLVFSEGVIQHFAPDGNPSRHAALAEMMRVLKPGGRLVIGVVNWHCYPHTLYKFVLKTMGRPYEYGYEQSFSTADLTSLLNTLGLRDTRSSGYYPAHALLRLKPYSRSLAKLGHLIDRFQANWFVNRFGFEIWVSATKPVSEAAR
jgi:SAM-dependent methyltransferase